MYTGCLDRDLSLNGMDTTLMEKIISLAKRRGFIYQGSEIYGGLARPNFSHIFI